MPTVQNGKPVPDYAPLSWTQHLIVQVFCFPFIIAYAGHFIRDIFLQRNPVLHQTPLFRPLRSGIYAVIDNSKGIIPEWAEQGLTGMIYVEIGDPLWSLGIRTVRQLRVIHNGMHSPTHSIIHASFPTCQFGDMRISYNMEAYNMLTLPNPIQAEFDKWYLEQNQWIPQLVFKAPQFLWFTLTPREHGIHYIFKKTSSLSVLFQPRLIYPTYPPRSYNNALGVPTAPHNLSTSTITSKGLSDDGSDLTKIQKRVVEE